MKKISHLPFPIKMMFGIIMAIIILTIINIFNWKQNTITEKFEKTDLSWRDIINCTLDLASSVSVESLAMDRIVAEITKMKTPSEVTITWILWDRPKIKWDKWEEVEVTKISTPDTILFLEKAGSNIHTWAFFPETWILIVSKTYNLITPYGAQVIWFCK